MKSIQETYICPMLWRGLSVGTLGEVRPCCFWPEVGNLHESTLEDIWNSNMMVDRRKRMLSGERIPECQICFDQEDRGQGSTRLAYFKECQTRDIQTVGPAHSNLDPRIIDLRFSNLCNLRCRTCWAGASSRWQSELGLENGLKNTTITQRADLQKLIYDHLDDIVEIYFAGGEPLIIEEDWEILKTFIHLRKTKTYLRYSTNLTQITYKGQNILDWWERWLKIGGKLQLGISIDGVGEVVEFIRTGTKWDILDSNIREAVKRLTKYPGCVFEFSPVVSTYNVLRLPDLFRYAAECELSPWHVLNHNFLQHPLAINIRNLTDSTKLKVKSCLDLEYKKEKKGEIKDRIGKYKDTVEAFMFQDPIDRDTLNQGEYWYHYCRNFDETFNRINPELKNWWLELPQVTLDNGKIDE